MSILRKIFGDPNEKYVKKLQPIIDKINSFEPEFERLSNEELKKKTDEFKERLQRGETLDDILTEAFALCREAAKRTLKQRHFDVQIIGGFVLHQGKIAEMKTGEGKTLAATLPAYLNGLEGKGVHIITVNDYLAKRDTVWMGQIYHALGLSVGCIVHDTAFLYDPDYQIQNQSTQTSLSARPSTKIKNFSALVPNGERDKERDLVGGFKVVESYLRPCSRKEAYLADITYGTNNEFGFDYLRDNMVYDVSQEVQRGFNFAIVDEVDSILIDEARVPLIISGQADEKTEKYYQFSKVVAPLKENEDYIRDEKMKVVTFTETGQNKIVKSLGQDPWLENDIATTHQLEAALRAKTLFQRDKDYVVKNNEIMIIDEFTGRILPGRRWSAGLHQAIEAKEGLVVKPESLTLATITFQNYFRLYKKLAGMTGTAQTSAEEFDKVYHLDVVTIPTNKPMLRKDFPDRIYKTENGKFSAVVKEIKELHKKGQPILVGTRSVEKNEYLGKLLEREGVSHQILNAKQHEREGEIIAQAGKLGAVTIATNMAGRGVDIILGGNPQNKEEAKKVVELGGLHVIGTERHEARRIDNQLRGRSGRQGDPGSSQFFVSLEDDLMRIFGGDRIKSLMGMLKIPEDQPVEANLISGAIESAQSKIEGFNFDARKHLLEYDDVMNKHRETIYKKRKEILERAENKNLKEYILEILKRAGYTEDDYLKKEKETGADNMRQLEKFVCLRVLDTFWIEHLENMEHLRDSVRLRAYGQQDPLVEYKNEGRKMFQRLLIETERVIAENILKADLHPAAATQIRADNNADSRRFNQRFISGRGAERRQESASNQRANRKIGRNDPCPCGSGKKYKRCCGR